jgi:hypothetical protein
MLDYGPGSAGLSGPGTARCRADYAEAGPTWRAGCHGRAGEKGRDPCRAKVHKMAAREIKHVPLLCGLEGRVGRRVRGRACVRARARGRARVRACKAILQAGGGVCGEAPAALSSASRSLAFEYKTPDWLSCVGKRQVFCVGDR